MSHSETLSRLTIGKQEERHDQMGTAEMAWEVRAGVELRRQLYARHDRGESARRMAVFRVTALGQFRRDIPIEAWYAAGITAVRHEDCGPCTQLAVTMAERTGVSPAVLRAVLADNREAMPPDVRLVWNFTRATLAHDAAADEYREAIVKRWGGRALVSLAFAITAARIYPTVKYALGHGEACRRVVVGGTPVMFDHGRVPADIAVRTP